jgi:universal stress protein A
MENRANAMPATLSRGTHTSYADPLETVDHSTVESAANMGSAGSRAHVNKESGCRLKRILVPIDFSAASSAALEFAKSLAAQYDARLLLLHVIDINAQYPRSTALPASEMMTELWTRGLTAMRELSRSLENQVAVRTVVEDGLPWEQIVSWSEESDLVILANNGKWSPWKIFSRHTMERVLQKAACPLMIVHHHN